MCDEQNLDWYGERATVVAGNADFTTIEYDCDGDGQLLDYALFPGIDLIFTSFHCTDTFREPIPNRDVIEIRHCRTGRIEFEMRTDKVFHMKEGELCINALVNIPAAYSFPFDYSEGLSIVIDRAAVDEETRSIFSFHNIDVGGIGSELDIDKRWFLCQTPAHLLHIFDELYAAKKREGRDYFRIKILELFYHIKRLSLEDQYDATYYSRAQIEIIKRVRRRLIENHEDKLSIDALLRNEPMSKVTFQTIFKQIYGDTPYAHVKKYKMNLAAIYLQQTDWSITEIAGSLGYANSSKFAAAFQSVFGMLPKDYRRAKKST
ncbi:MAG: AraC family transcriptional regulator [Peptococcaceae bacterium]|nr:AraC family transcriptional regulator [Peptococcaceae bacterium]